MYQHCTHSLVVVFQPKSEDRGALGSVPFVLSCYVTPSTSFTSIVSPLNPPTPSSPLPPYLFWPPSPPPPPYLPYYSALVLVIPHNDSTTIVIPMLPSILPPPEKSPLSDESRYNGWWFSEDRGHIYPPPLYTMTTLMLTEAGITTSLQYLTLYELLTDGGPPCGGIRRGFSLSWGSPPRSLIQTGGLPEPPPYKKFWGSGGLPPHGPNRGET